MATTKWYLDTRAVRDGNEASLKLVVRKKRVGAMMGVNVRLMPYQWDARGNRVIGPPNKQYLNAYLMRRKVEADTAILKLVESGKERAMTAYEIRDHVDRLLHGEAADGSALFAARFKEFAGMKRDGTRGVYMQTYRRMLAFDGGLERLRFEEVTRNWLTRFDNFLAKTSPSRNARNIHLRNIRAVFNDALADGVTNAYPFRKYKIRPEATAKRSLTLEQLRALFAMQAEGRDRECLDMFKLIFFLIGINVVDLCRLTGMTADGRVEYRRAKTGRLYSLKVEREAAEIVGRYAGGKGRLLDILGRYGRHTEYIKRINTGLKRLGADGRAECLEDVVPHLTTYWARHTWAAVAASLDIPKETIAAALGHGGNTVTDIYIDFDRGKVDEANRAVMDWVLYGRRARLRHPSAR